MKINLNKPESKQGALAALQLLKDMFSRDILADDSDVDNSKQQNGASDKKNDQQSNQSKSDKGDENALKMPSKVKKHSEGQPAPSDKFPAEGSSGDSSSDSEDSASDAPDGQLGDMNTDEYDSVLPDAEAKKIEDDADSSGDLDSAEAKAADVSAIEKEVADKNTDIEQKKAEAERARKARLASLNRAMDLSALIDDVKKLIGTQLRDDSTPESSWKRMNPSYAHSDLLVKGRTRVRNQTKPDLLIVIDQSGSFGSAERKKADQIDKALEDLIRRGKINKPTRLYFADSISLNYGDNLGGGTHGFPAALNWISEHVNEFPNVIVISDSDIDTSHGWHGQSDWGKLEKDPVKVRGAVLWAWVNNNRASGPLRHLVGAKSPSNNEYSI